MGLFMFIYVEAAGIHPQLPPVGYLPSSEHSMWEWTADYGEDSADREFDGRPTLVEKTYGHQGAEREWQLPGNAILQNILSWVFVERRSGGRTTSSG